MAPELDAGFAGLSDTHPSVVPPDTMGAAGPDHLVTLLNSQFAIFSKTAGLSPGTVISLDTFWASVLPGQPENFPFDPKVIFDQSSGRFIFSSVGGPAAPDSWLLIGLSTTSNPSDDVFKWAIDADKDADNVVRNNSADFPQLGVDELNVYITANMFDNTGGFQYSKVWVIPKAQLLSGNTVLTWAEFRILPSPPQFWSSIQPAVSIGPTTAEYFIYEDDTPGTLHLARVTGPEGSPVWDDLGTVAVAPYTPQTELPQAPQLGTLIRIDTSDSRLLNAIYRGGSLWTIHTVNAPVGAPGKTEVAWYKIDPVSHAAADQGRISDPNRWYYMPSVAVNADGDMAIGLNGSSSTEYAGAYYTLRRASDPATTTQAPALLKTGIAPYTPFANRWGDYSATVVDPVDNVTFWTLQEYAAGTSNWGTWWGKFHPSGLVAPDNLAATALSLSQVRLSWINSSTGRGIRIERKNAPALDYAQIALVDNAVTSYLDNTVAPGTMYRYRLLVFDSAGGSYSAEALVQVPAPPGGSGGGCAVIPGARSRGIFSSADVVIPLLVALLILALRRRTRSGTRKDVFSAFRLLRSPETRGG